MSNHGDVKYSGSPEAYYKVSDTCAQLCFPLGQIQENNGRFTSPFPVGVFQVPQTNILRILSAEIFISVSLGVWQVLARPGHFFPSLWRKLHKPSGQRRPLYRKGVNSTSFYFCDLKYSMADCTDLIFFPLL